MIMNSHKNLGSKHAGVWKPKKSLVELRVANKAKARELRHYVQYAIMSACGFRGLKGWTNQKARSLTWFRIRMKQSKVKNFIGAVTKLARRGNIELRIGSSLISGAAKSGYCQ
jgi:hypothetical protein